MSDFATRNGGRCLPILRTFMLLAVSMLPALGQAQTGGQQWVCARESLGSPCPDSHPHPLNESWEYCLDQLGNPAENPDEVGRHAADLSPPRLYNMNMVVATSTPAFYNPPPGPYQPDAYEPHTGGVYLFADGVNRFLWFVYGHECGT